MEAHRPRMMYTHSSCVGMYDYKQTSRAHVREQGKQMEWSISSGNGDRPPRGATKTPIRSLQARGYDCGVYEAGISRRRDFEVPEAEVILRCHLMEKLRRAWQDSVGVLAEESGSF